MARNGTGTYNLTTGQPVAINTVIDETVFNTLMTDVALALTNSLAANGETPTTAAIPFAAGITLSGSASNFATGANFISYGGTDAGLSFDASNNATLSGALAVGTSISTGTGTTITAGLKLINGTAGVGSAYGGIYAENIVPSTSNYAFATRTDGTTTGLNAGTNAYLSVGGTTVVNVTAGAVAVIGTLGVSGNTSLGVNPSTTGILNFPNNNGIYSRNAANSADIALLYLNTSNALIIPTAVVTLSGTTINMTTSSTVLTVGVGANNGTVSAGVFTDRTKAFEGDAVAAVKQIKAKNGHIDHASLPAFALANVPKQVTDAVGKVTETIEVERDIGAMISILTVATQQLDARLDKLEAKP